MELPISDFFYSSPSLLNNNYLRFGFSLRSILESIRHHTCTSTFTQIPMRQVHVDQSCSLYLSLFELAGNE